MMKYGPIICDPTSEEAEALVGKKVICSDTYRFIENCDEYSLESATLVKIKEACSYPFMAKRNDGWNKSYTFIREVIEDEPQYRPYNDCEEMIDDFCKRFGRSKLDNSMPLIWLRFKRVFSIELVQTFGDDGVRVDTDFLTLDEIFTEYTYLDGTPVGKEVT